MRIIKTPVGIYSDYNKGKVKHIDFTYCDYIIVWVQYKTKTVGYVWQG